MKTISKLALASLLLAGAGTSSAADTSSSPITLTGTGVAACTITAPAYMSIGTAVSGRKTATRTPVTIGINCSVPWTFTTLTTYIFTNGAFNGNQFNRLSLAVPGAAVSSLADTYTFSGNGVTSSTNFSLEAISYNTEKAGAEGLIGVGAFTTGLQMYIQY